MNKIIVFAATNLILFMVFSSRLTAQETGGGLEGRIVDSAGLPLSGVTVMAGHLPTGSHYQVVTDRDGRYQLTNLRIGGPYVMDISYTGKLPQRKEDITVSLGRSLRIDFVMAEKAAVLKDVIITGRRAASKDAYGAGTNISSSRISSMPTASRSIQDMTRMVPQGSKDNSFGGANFRYNNVTIDGAINNDAIGFSPSLGGITGSSGMPGSSTRSNPISIDAIEDIQVYLSPYDVKIGNFTGGSINAVTRSGSNDVTGSVYVTARNSSLTGPDHAGDGSKMPSGFHETQTGFRVGLPIVKNKLFFFTNEEITRRQDVILLGAGSKGSSAVISGDSARMIVDYLRNNYGFNAGRYGNYLIYSNSDKFFNRLDWNINSVHQLAIRNNFVSSESTNLERDQQNFRFSSIDYVQKNRQQSTVAELKSRWPGGLSNVFMFGYTSVHDSRTPTSAAAFPQVQIAGNTPGTTIFLGTDREASIFDMRQKTVEITNNLSWHKGRNNFLFGTHNELYSIQYGFVNSWNGRVDYLSIHDLLNNQPSRVRGNYNYTNNDRNYILMHPSARFAVNMYSVYLQDEIRINERLKVNLGIRADMTIAPKKQVLSDKTKNALPDPYFGSTYTYTPLNQVQNDFFGWKEMQPSPRVGVNWDIRGDQSLVLRGGSGLFTGRIPLAWMGYSYYNNGDSYGAYDQRVINKPFTPGTDPLLSTKNGIASFAQANGQAVSDKYAGATQVDVIDNNFKMPQVWRSSVALDRKTANGWSFTAEIIYTKTVYDVKFQQVNVKDNPQYFAYDTIRRQQPVFGSGNADPAFTNAYELSNTSQGYRYSATVQTAKNFSNGFNGSVAYTYGQSKDITNGIRNSMESNWQLNQALNPNKPGLAWSNFDIRHRFVGNIGYHTGTRHWGTLVSLFISAQSGSPFTYGFVNTSIQGTPQQVSLAYIPKAGESVLFFQDIYAPGSEQVTVTASQQADAFDRYIDQNTYLRGRRANWTERNAGRTPWNVQADLRIVQDLHFLLHGRRQTLSFTYDIINLTNLLCSKWGWVYFSPNTFNSTASVGLTQVLDANQKPLLINGGYPAYTFSDPGRPYSVDFFNSRWQMQVGLRYSFF
ncbi:TonB-dependent receptor [Flavitalea flava]